MCLRICQMNPMIIYGYNALIKTLGRPQNSHLFLVVLESGKSNFKEPASGESLVVVSSHGGKWNGKED